VLFDEKSSLAPTQVSALSQLFDSSLRFTANFVGVTLAPTLSALATLRFQTRHKARTAHDERTQRSLETSAGKSKSEESDEKKEHIQELKAQRERANRVKV